MNNSKFLILLLAFFSITISMNAQDDSEEVELSLDKGSIENQFEYVKENSNKYNWQNKTYRVIKEDWFARLKAHTIDTLNEVHKTLDATQNVVIEQKKEIATLKNNLSETESTLGKTREEKDSMALFGLQMSKTGYNALMWSIIFSLLFLLLLFIYRFKNSNTVTKEAKQALAETQEEYENHRRVALEREQKVRRQLQDELNKRKHGN